MSTVLDKLFIVLPIYNEADNVETLIRDIDAVCRQQRIEYTAVCINDGSNDGSGQILDNLGRQFPLHVVTHRRNRGLGETIRDGFETAADLAGADDIIVRMDADCTHEPKYIPALLAAIENGADVAIASRFPPGGGMVGVGADRMWISKVANIIFRVCFPLGGVREYTCGYRAYRAALVKSAFEYYGNNLIQLCGLGFCCTVEKLLKFKLLGARLVEVPFVLRYDLKAGQSKMVFNVTTFGYAIMIVLYHWPWGGWRRSKRHKSTRETARVS